MKNQNILTSIDKDSVVSLLQKMIQIKTVNAPGDEKPLAELLAKEMISFDMKVQTIDLAENRANVVGVLKGNGEKKALLFNGHLDTVPPGDVQWTYGPFSGELVDGKIYGRGSTDMKGGLAAMIIAAKAIKNAGIPLKGDLIIAGTAGEETDSIGAFDFLNKGGLNDVGAIVIGEPSSCGINVAEKGAFWVEITTYGKTAHGAFPGQGINAISDMHLLLGELLNYEFKYERSDLLGYPTMNISTIQGGVKTNVVPDKCTITIDMRTVPSINHEDILKDLQEIIDNLKKQNTSFHATIRVLNNRPSVETSKDHPFVKMAQDVIREEFNRIEEPKGVNFYTDAAVFLPAMNLPAIFYGPGDADMAHQPDEHVRVDSLVEAVQFYAAMIERYLG
ncbi:M20 family metallopeptidase [Clostridiaceae bacterium 35-E11]